MAIDDLISNMGKHFNLRDEKGFSSFLFQAFTFSVAAFSFFIGAKLMFGPKRNFQLNKDKMHYSRVISHNSKHLKPKDSYKSNLDQLVGSFNQGTLFLDKKAEPIIRDYEQKIIRTRNIKAVVQKVNRYDSYIRQYSKFYNVPGYLIKAIIAQESGGNHSSRSSKGAIGLMQLIPPTARYVKVDPYNIESNIKGGIKYFKEKLSYYPNKESAIARYNCSKNAIYLAIQKAGSKNFWKYRIYLPGETRDYVPYVLAWAKFFGATIVYVDPGKRDIAKR
jgi:hypothetical protein